MRALCLSVSLTATLLTSCASCPSADRAAVPSGSARARFVAVSSQGSNSQVTLVGGDLVPIRFDASGAPTDSWISNRSRWTSTRGTGIGLAPSLPQAISAGVSGLVTVLGATSIIALGLPTGQEDWEWIFTRTEEGELPPIVDVLVLPDVTVDMHDLAFVARDRVQNDMLVSGEALTSGGDLLVLDVETNQPAVLGSVSFDGLADDGLDLTARSLAFAGGFVYAALDHGLVVGPTTGGITRTGDGIIVAIDPVTRTVRHVLPLEGLTHCEQIVAIGGEPPSGRVVVACAGTPESTGEIPDDAGLVIIDRDPAGAGAPFVSRTLPAATLGIPSPDRGLIALRGSSVAFVSTGSAATPALEDRLYVVDVGSQRVDLLAAVPSDSAASPGGLGSGAYDPVPAPAGSTVPEGSTRFVVPVGRGGLRSWAFVPNAAMPGVFTLVEQAPTALTSCGNLPVRAVRLVP